MSRLIAAIIFVLLLSVACTSQPSVATPISTAAATDEAQPTTPAPAPTATPSPAPTVTAAPTATPTPLTPTGIFESLSPAVVRIEADRGFGSGVLIEGGNWPSVMSGRTASAAAC